MKMTAIPVLLLLTLAPVPAAGQETASPDVATEVAALRRSVDRLVVMLEKFLADQQLVLLMKRIELANDQLVPLQQELYKVRSNKEAAEQEIERLEGMKKQFDEQRDRAQSGDLVDDRELVSLRLMLEQADRQLEAAEARRFSLEQQELALENQMTARREKIETLEALVDRELGL